ncbi:Pre-rRNA-processing protein RIX1, N-terminal [Sesbania bispinosa]|nr:Pre-rRNA-processing protein RIX1, N-terminal [Sesbania bispinosa]
MLHSKPRLLTTLIRDHLPDEKHPFSNPSDLSRVVSLIKTHSLLSESVTESMDSKLVEAWKSAVTHWVHRILTLLSSTMPDKCWAGITLLGVTCEECSSDRFLESYSEWFQKSLSFLQSPADSHLVRVASCASISDLLARLSGFPKFKRDGSSCALKVVQPVLRMLQDDNSETICGAAVHLLCTIITTFPFSIHRHYDSVESVIASKFLSGGCSLDMLKKLAHCLALLPKSKGDEESWSVMMQKILVLINDQLNLAFQGLEEETMRKEVIRLLVLPGKQPLPPLGGHVSGEEASNKAIKRSEQSLMSNVSILMFGCCKMLTNSYPVKVNVPFRLLLALVERILLVNGSLPQMSLPFMTAKQQENICSELPVLHSCSLELLMAIIKATGSQLLPHAASIVRVITKYFRTCALPELRIKVYSVTKTLLISMGVGMALCLAQEVINNAIADLSTIENKNGGTLNGLNSDFSTGAPVPPGQRKRKHSSTAGSLQEYDEGGGLGVEVPKKHPLTPISLRIAALEALEAVITVAGALKSEQWRSKVDSLLIVVAMDSFKERPSSEEISAFQQKEPAATTTDLQLAALHALLASFLSFARLRPPYLARGLELFHRGKQQTGTKLAEFCAHALLTLEVLIHPRALPVLDYGANNNSFGEAQFNFQDEYVIRNNSTPFGLPQAVPHDYDDDLCTRWLENGSEAVVSLAKKTTEPSEACRDNDPKVLSVNLSSDTNIQEKSEMLSGAATCADVEMRTVEDETIFKSDQPGESVVQFQEPISCTASIPDTNACDAVATEIGSERIVTESAMPHMEPGQGSSVNKNFELASQSNSSLQRTSDSNMIQEFAFKFDYDNLVLDEDGFPEIVDGDPDSE